MALKLNRNALQAILDKDGELDRLLEDLPIEALQTLAMKSQDYWYDRLTIQEEELKEFWEIEQVQMEESRRKEDGTHL